MCTHDLPRVGWQHTAKVLQGNNLQTDPTPNSVVNSQNGAQDQNKLGFAKLIGLAKIAGEFSSAIFRGDYSGSAGLFASMMSLGREIENDTFR